MRVVSFTLLSLAGVASALTPAFRSSRTRITKSAAPKAVAVPLTDASDFGEQEDPHTTQLPKQLAPEDEWVAKLDYDGFGKEVTALGRKLLAEGGEEDVQHLNKIVSWRDVAAIVGVSTMWMTPNPITIVALSTWTYASWCMIAHHTCHGGYNRVDAGKFNSRGFALGTLQRRVSDWLDWMAPEAWNVEHNRLHHYRLNEESDPDLVQRNMRFVRNSDMPVALKYGIVAFFLPVWKWFYYAPNTYKELQINKWKQEGRTLPPDFEPKDSVTIVTLLSPGKEYDALREVVPPKEFFTESLGPMLGLRYLLLPAPLLLIPGAGPVLFFHAIINLVLAELVTNLHSFITIVTNHAGNDLYTFDDGVKPKTSSFYVRQIVGSANYATGDDVTDFSHGWLNYQIEHHVFPDLSMRQYQKAAPELKSICAKYGVPYVQESVWERLRKTVDIMIGKETMRTFPTEYEPARDKAGAKGVIWKTTNGAIDED